MFDGKSVRWLATNRRRYSCQEKLMRLQDCTPKCSNFSDTPTNPKPQACRDKLVVQQSFWGPSTVLCENRGWSLAFLLPSSGTQFGDFAGPCSLSLGNHFGKISRYCHQPPLQHAFLRGFHRRQFHTVGNFFQPVLIHPTAVHCNIDHSRPLCQMQKHMVLRTYSEHEFIVLNCRRSHPHICWCEDTA